MHIMATNFSVWLATVAGEATEALIYEQKVMDWQADQEEMSSYDQADDKVMDELQRDDSEVTGKGFCLRIMFRIRK